MEAGAVSVLDCWTVRSEGIGECESAEKASKLDRFSRTAHRHQPLHERRQRRHRHHRERRGDRRMAELLTLKYAGAAPERTAPRPAVETNGSDVTSKSARRWGSVNGKSW